MDEPTNHLDITAKDVLKNALLNYNGSLILVSHDRYFLHGLTTRTIYFHNKEIREYPGDIYDFIGKQKILNLKELETTDNKKKVKIEKNGKSKIQIDREEKKKIQRDQNRIKKQIVNIESEIENMENQISDLEKIFSDPESIKDIDKMHDKQMEYDFLRKELSEKMEEWTQLNDRLEELS